MHCRPFIFVAAISAATITMSAAPAASEDAGRAVTWRATPVHITSSVNVARDVSFPQCGLTMPSERSAAFGILGTNNGTSFRAIPVWSAS